MRIASSVLSGFGPAVSLIRYSFLSSKIVSLFKATHRLKNLEPLTTLHDLRILNGMVNDSAEQLTTVFFARADPTRRDILERLAHGAASGTEMALPFSLTAPSLSKL